MSIKVLIADDHELFLESLASLIRDFDGIEVVDKARDGEDALRRLMYNEVDVLIADYNMPLMDGIALTQQAKLRQPKLQILMLTMVETTETIKAAIKAGAIGYMLKNSKRAEFEKAIRNVAKGKRFFNETVFQKLISDETFEYPTEREIEIIKLIANEKSSQEIAKALSISLNTVETHRKNIFRKIGVKNAFGLLKYALTHHLIEL
ncbi:response regulator transcription factor [Emticicia sp. SJ17W-69]|uniref:response regulator transcription factor n=1 Tax=Emticicia sp. SJ17W-69 TaxID=3421657 RepID=UPI003EBA02EF